MQVSPTLIESVSIILDHALLTIMRDMSYSDQDHTVVMEIVESTCRGLPYMDHSIESTYDSTFGYHASTTLNIDDKDSTYAFSPQELDVIVETCNLPYMGMKEVIDGRLQISINIHRLHTFMRRHGSVSDIVTEKVDALYSQYVATIEHELIHVMQEVVLGSRHVSSMMASRTCYDTTEEFEAYLLSSVEYDPHINDAILEFRRNLTGLEKYFDISVENKKGILYYYLTGRLDRVTMHDTIQQSVVERMFGIPEFLLLLKTYDPLRWKKAVRRITSEILTGD